MTDTTTRPTNTGAVIGLLAAIAGLICYFLPWFEGGVFGFTQSASALRFLSEAKGDALQLQLLLSLLALLAALLAAGVSVFKGQAADRDVAGGLILAGLISAGMLGYLYVSFQMEMNRQPSDPFGQLMQGLARSIVTANILYGAYGAFFSSLGVLLGGVLGWLSQPAAQSHAPANPEPLPIPEFPRVATTSNAPALVTPPVVAATIAPPPPPVMAAATTRRSLAEIAAERQQAASNAAGNAAGNRAAAPTDRSCAHCGRALPPGVRYCTSCGTQLLSGAPAPPPPAPQNFPARPGGDLFVTHQAAKDQLIGRTLEGKYRLDAVIGAGGMGTVYRATRLMIGDAIAIKVLNREQVSAPQSLERFRREAQAAARLKHPNAVTVYDFGIAPDGLVFLAMELVEGQSLRALLKQQGPLTPPAAAEVLQQACSALDEAHRQQIVHRDVKPDNIIVNASPAGLRVKVLDFGIAKLRDLSATATSLTQTGSVMGTPQYMSPEQCLGEELDHRSDVYSLGVVLYEMLTGIVPFNSPTPMAVVVQHVNQAPTPPRAINLSLSPAVESVVLHALQKPREARPQTAGELAQRLLAAVGGYQQAAPFSGARPVAAPFTPAPQATGAPVFPGQPPAGRAGQVAASGMMPTQVMQRMSSGQVAAPIGHRFSSGASAATPLFDTPAATVTGDKQRTQLAIAGGAAALIIIALLSYFVFFSAKRNVLAELKKGNLVIPEGSSAYDLFSKHGKNNFSSSDLADIEREAVPALERRAEQILTRLKQEANESETEWVEATRLFTWLNELRPQSAYESRRYFSQARLSFLKSDNQRALADYRRAIELDGSWALPFNGLARAFLKLKDRTSAREYYQRATAVEPQWLYPWLNLGGLNYELNDYYGAEQAMRQALQIDPQRASAHYFLALALEKQGRVCAALSELQLALNNAYNNNSPGFNVDNARKKLEFLSARVVC